MEYILPSVSLGFFSFCCCWLLLSVSACGGMRRGLPSTIIPPPTHSTESWKKTENELKFKFKTINSQNIDISTNQTSLQGVFYKALRKMLSNLYLLRYDPVTIYALQCPTLISWAYCLKCYIAHEEITLRWDLVWT